MSFQVKKESIPIQNRKIQHQPVLVNEILSALCGTGDANSPGRNNIYIDCTLGMGGHTEAILKATAPHGKVIGIDRDSTAIDLSKKRLALFTDRLTLRKGTFKELVQIVTDLNIKEVDGILFDLGISSYQLDTAARGFSFQKSGALDMRMDSESGETAADLIRRLSQKELTILIKTFGEERWAARIASGIIRFRSEKGEMTRTEELEQVIWQATPSKFRHGRTHPATRTFQALRMVVNREIEQIEAGLSAAIPLLGQGGRLAVISFHSLEDRCVKQTFKSWAKSNTEDTNKQFINLYKKPVIATPEETSSNRRARSAKLRVLQRAA